MSLEEAVSQLPLELREHIYRFVIAAFSQELKPMKELIALSWVRHHLNHIIHTTITVDVNKGLDLLQELEKNVLHSDHYSSALKRRMLSKTTVAFNMLSRMVGMRWLITLSDVSEDDMPWIEHQVEEAQNAYFMYIRYDMTMPVHFPPESDSDWEEYDIPAMVGVLIFDKCLSYDMVSRIVGDRCKMAKSSSSMTEHLAVLLNQSDWIYGVGNPEIYQQHLLQDAQAGLF